MSAVEDYWWRYACELIIERDRARDIAVALEQENAALREWLEFVRWGIVA